MTTVKRITDLSGYRGVLPFASELTGIYQPLIGWKSQRAMTRFKSGFNRDRALLLKKLAGLYEGKFSVQYDTRPTPDFQGVATITLQEGASTPPKSRSFDSELMRYIASLLPAEPPRTTTEWEQAVPPSRALDGLARAVAPYYQKEYEERATRQNVLDVQKWLEAQLAYESQLSGAMTSLIAQKRFDVIESLFYSGRDTKSIGQSAIDAVLMNDEAGVYIDLENVNPRDPNQLANAVLSPIGLIHLFRQYFFELDTFLGPPVHHVWLAPGATVELVEIQTRRSIVERTFETTLDVQRRTERTTTVKDEFSNAIKDDNSQNIQLGASVQATYATVQASSSFAYATSHQTAREKSHKQLREQSDKIASDVRNSFKSIFRSVDEYTSESSVKHVLANTTGNLINYELRRKMRQVGVQNQAGEMRLGWQTYVDDPGRELGLAQLVHIARPASLDEIPDPDLIPRLQPFTEERIITIPFVPTSNGADRQGEVYIDGVEEDNTETLGSLEKIQADFVQKFVCQKPEHALSEVVFDPQGASVVLTRGPITMAGDPKDSTALFNVHLSSADFQGQSAIQVNLILHWSPLPSANAIIDVKNAELLASRTSAQRLATEKAYIETIKERVTATSKLAVRKAAELREEERIAVYRRLIQELLLAGVPLPDDRTRHVVAEMLNSIFDVEKMLYYVAPEWWRPRLHRGKQQMRPASGGIDGAATLASSSVGWGGVDDLSRDNYLITDDSEPAKLGSSLGWLLQLDGDNLRNAFLNAPWVKAVIPIRPGKEEAAINWLKGVEGLNGIGEDDRYVDNSHQEMGTDGEPLDGRLVIDVLLDLAKRARLNHEESLGVKSFPEETPANDPNKVNATPVDRVYEHGFYPLEGGFRAVARGNFEIFDQWTEVLPTDQIAPVEVKYDPLTGRQITPAQS